MVARIGPNDPCPCGSGKKFKRCCQDADAAMPSGVLPPDGDRHLAAHVADEYVVHRIIEFGERRFGPRFDPRTDFETRLGTPSDDLQIFVPWTAYHYRIDGKSLLEHFLLAKQARLASDERAWLEAQRSARLSHWEAIDVVPGETVTVRDAFTGDERVVVERLGSRGIRRWDAVLGRVMDFAGVSYFCGTRSRVLPPKEAADAARLVRRALRTRRERVPRQLLESAEGEVALFMAWETMVGALDHRPSMPELRNTDGEPFRQITDDFALAGGAGDEVARRLSRVAGVEVDAIEGGLHFTFTRPGNRMHASWDNTIIGHADLTARSLTIETNSKNRADGMRRLVEAACGNVVEHLSRSSKTPAQLLQAARSERRAAPTSDESLPALRAFKEEHYAEWLDAPIPALGGLTPRQAARNRGRRIDLDCMLEEIERREASVPQAARFDVEILRRDLGL